MASTELESLLAKREIYEVVLRYCRGVDRLDLDLVRSCYHPDGVDNHTGFGGTVDEYLAWVAPLLREYAGTMHIVGNHFVEVWGDQAVSETYGTAVHWGSPTSNPRRNFTSGFRYVDLMAKRSGRWAIVERHAVREWTHSNAEGQIAPEGDGPRGRRDRTDVVFALRARAQRGSPGTEA